MNVNELTNPALEHGLDMRTEFYRSQHGDATEAWREVDRLCKLVRYLVGIAERGEGRKIKDDEPIELFVLSYVKKLEAHATSDAVSLDSQKDKE
jgi:hypothetical protein